MQNIISISCNISGIGKTTTAINLAASLAVFERRTLMIDCSHNFDSVSLIEPVSMDRQALSIHNSKLEYLDFIYDHSFSNILEQEDVSKNVLIKKIPQLSDYDFIVLDTSAEKNKITERSICLSDHVVIPVQCIEGIFKNILYFLGYLNTIRQKNRSQVKIAGLLFNEIGKRAEIIDFFDNTSYDSIKGIMFDNGIPFEKALNNRNSLNRIACLKDIGSPGSEAFLDFSYELLHKI